MPAASTAFAAVLLICTGSEGCDTTPVKDATRYVTKSDCVSAIPALPPVRKAKYKCEPVQELTAQRARPITADDVASSQLQRASYVEPTLPAPQ